MAAPKVNPQIKAQDKNVQWYQTELETVSPQARELLEKYSHIPPAEVIPHILKIRDRAWSIFPYPCIGRFRFLDLSISLSPLYPTLLNRLVHSSHTLLDLGCCFAQDIRKLVHDGVPSQSLYGAELRPEFIELGYELFKDKETLQSSFLVGDLFTSSSGGQFRELEKRGGVDVVYAASLFHLFDWGQQVQVAERVVGLLKKRRGSVVLGRQRGNREPREYEHRTNQGGTMFRHNEESWREMWRVVGEKTGTQWDVHVKLTHDDAAGRYNAETNGFGVQPTRGDGSLYFEVTRL